MHWKGYFGDTGGVGGSATWDGVRLQWVQLVLVAWMLLVIPAQKIDASAFDITFDVPW